MIRCLLWLVSAMARGLYSPRALPGCIDVVGRRVSRETRPRRLRRRTLTWRLGAFHQFFSRVVLTWWDDALTERHALAGSGGEP